MFRSLRARLTLLTLVIGIVPLIAVGAVLTLRSFDQEQTKALDARHEITLRVAQQVTAFINEREIELRELIEVRGLSEISLNEQQTLLSSLLNYQPVFNELTLLDRLGEEQIRLSRQVVFSEEDLRSRSESDEFVFASVDRQTYYSPVILDESTGEPFMTLSLPVIDRRTNDVVGVLVGQIRFRSVQELIAEVEVEGNEDVYLVDSAGKLVAHRNPSLVLGGRQFDVPDEDGAYNGLHGDRALLASTEVVLGRQRFRLVSELPESEGLQGAFQTLYLVLGALAGAVILTGLIGFLASRQFARPVNALVAAARGLGGGDLSRRAEMTGLNETDTLGQALNTMAAQVQDLVGSLEARVADRTRDLFLTLEVGQTISRSSQQKDTLQHTVDFIQDRFNLYYVQVYLIDDAQRFAILTAGTGDVGHELLTRQHRLDLRETSIVARTYQSRRPVLVTDTAASDIHRPNPLLPDTRSEVAIPLISGDEVIGVLDMQARKAETFREDNLPVFQAMSSQLSSGLRAAQFFIEMQEAVERAASINRRLTGEAWEGYLGRAGQGGRVGYRYDLQMVQPMAADSETGNGHAARIERPITLREQPIGQIVLGENSDRDWSQEEIELVDQVASRVALTLEQYRAFDETAVALAQAEVLYRASQRIAAADNTQDLLSALVESVKIPAFNRAILFTFERDSDHTVTAWNVMANWHDGRGLPPTAVSTRMPRQGNEMDLMATSNTALFFYDAQDKRFTRFDEYARTRFVERNIHALGMLPLWVGARQLGIIVLEGEESHQFAADETRALETLAGQVAVAVDGLQLLQQTQQRAAEMQTVAVVGAQASSSLDLYKLLRDVSTLTKERFELYHAHVYLLNELGDHLVLAAGAGRAGEILVAAGHRIAITNARSLVARAARSREVVITNDVTTTPDFLPNPMLPQTRAEMAMPLIAGDEVVGVLDVQSEKPGRFTEADANVQMTLAAQVASAVQNARLYETIQRRAAEMQTVAELGSEATSALDLDTLLRRAVNLTKERFELYHAHIYLLDEQGAQLVLAAGAGEAGEQMVAAQHRIPANHPRSLVARASRTREAVIVNDVTAVPDFLPNPLLPNTHSELALPLVIGDQIFGVLDVQSAVTDRFTEQDVAVYTTLASQITAAVQNVRLFETVNDREQQFRALFEQSNDAIFLMRATDGVLVDWNKRTLEYFGAEPEDLVGKTPGDFSPMIQPDGSDSNEKAREMIAAAAAGHPQFFTWMHRRVDGSEFYADISLNSVEVRGEILTQATIRDITERLKAQETIQRRALEMQTVSEVGAAATASLDVNRLLRDVANLTKERFNLYHAHVYLLDDTGENLLLAAGAGQVGQRMASAGHRISTNNERSLVARAARGGQPVLVNDVTKAPDFLPNPMLPMTRSEMAVPLIVGDRVSGVLDVQSDVAGRFTEEDTVVYTTLAGQVSAALRNVSLFETVEEREQLLRTIINTTPDWIYVKDRDYRYLIANQAIAENYGGRTPEEMIGKNDYDLGVAVELIEGNPEKGIRGFRLDDQDVLERGLDVHNPYNVVDYVDGTRHILNTSKLPLRDQDGNIIGVLGVSRDVTEALKAQETIQRRALEMQTVSEVGAAASASLDADQLLSDVANLTKERFELYHTHVYLLDDTGENLLLAAGAGQIGQQMVAAGHRISPDNERSLVARAARSGQPVLVNDVTRAPDFLPNPMLPKTRSEMAVPLIVSDQVIGVLDVQSDVSGRFTEEDAVVYTTLAGQVSAALQNVRLLSTSQRRAVEMQTVSEVGAAAATSLDADQLLSDVANLTKERFELYHTHVYMLDDAGQNLLLAAGAGQIGQQMVAAGHRIAVDNERSLVARAARSGQSVLVNDVTKAPDFLPNPMLPKTRSEMAVPLLAGDRVIGVMDVQSEVSGRFTEEDTVVYATLAGQVSSALQNVRLFETVEEREQLLRTIIDTTPDWIFAKDTNYRYLLTNKAFAEFYGGRAPAEMIGKDDYDLGTPAELVEGNPEAGIRGFRTDDREVVVDGLMLHNAHDVVDYADGTRHILDTNKLPLRDPQGNIIGVLGISRDVTESLKAQETIQRRAVEMQTVSEVGAAAAASLDVERLLREVSNLTKERFGLYHAHVYLIDEEGDNLVLAAGAGRPGERMLAAGHRIAAANERSLVARASRSRQVVMVNDVTQVPDFLPNPLLPRTRSEMAIPLIAGEAVIGVLDVQSDQPEYFSNEDIEVQMTLASQVAVAVQNARLYTEQVRTAERLRDVDRLKSEFLASMSHELRTPLNSIIGYAEVLLDGIDGELTGDMTEDISAIHGSGKHLLNLINDILDLAKIEAGQMDLVVEEVKLTPLVEDVFNTARVLLKNKPVELIMEIPADLPVLRADALRLRQVVSNLLTNAIKFTEQGSITLHAEMHRLDRNMVEISIRDTGVGMKPEHLALIFDRFRQVDQSHTRRAGGTGLGLSIMRQLVEMHGGQVWVDSELGVGSVFAFTIPAVLD